MRLKTLLLLAGLPLLSACNNLSTTPDSEAADVVSSGPSMRLRGDLLNTGTVLLKPCNSADELLLDTSSDPELMARMVAALLAGDTRSQFIDLKGREVTGADGEQRLLPEQIYRLETESSGCADEEYARLVVSASGNEPSWLVRVLPKGMLIQRPEYPDLVLPFLEENMPDGRMGFSSEANGQRIELWLTPGRCNDSMSDAFYHLTASLHINEDRPLTGCATLGGARE